MLQYNSFHSISGPLLLDLPQLRLRRLSSQRKHRNLCPCQISITTHSESLIHTAGHSSLHVRRLPSPQVSNLPPTPEQAIRQSSLYILAVEIAADSALKLGSTLAKNLGKILQIVSSRDAKLANKVLGCTFKVSIFISAIFLLGTSKVCVRRNS